MRLVYKKISILFLFFSFVCGVQAQEDSREHLSIKYRKIDTLVQEQQSIAKEEGSYLKIQNKGSFTRNDSLYIKFELSTQGKIIKRGEALSLIPEYRRGNDTYEFPAILINGRKRNPYYKREQALATPESYWQYKPYATLVVQRKGEQQVDYDYALPLPGGTEKGKLFIKYLKQDCCDISLEKTDSLVLEYKDSLKGKKEIVHKLLVGYPEYAESVTYIEPKEEVEKRREETIVIHIKYPVDKSKVLPDFADNAIELKKVDKLLRHFMEDKETYTVEEGSIVGYASPEATYDYNLRLSKRRAKDFYDYLLDTYKKHNLPKFEVSGVGEDWEGLYKGIDKTDMEYKNRVLYIIDVVSIFSGREKQLMDLAGGAPYRYMLRNLFPPLRRIEMKLKYRVKSFTKEESKQVFVDRPKDLSQREFYQLTKGRMDKKALEVAVHYFPDDITANINAFSASLVRGDMEAAYKYLLKVEEESLSYNSTGVYYLIKGDIEKARSYFEKSLAIPQLKENALYNLELLKQIEEEKTMNNE